jgi:tRNA G18 (ribose-2'-O)-methylase SpoU
MNGPHAVTSIDDPRIDVYRDVRDRDLRGRDGVFMAESESVIRRLLRMPERLHSLLLSPTRLDALGTALDVLPDTVPVYVAPVDTMTEIAGFHIHRGVLAAGYRPTPEALAYEPFIEAMPDSGPCLVLAAAGITNVDNMGGLFRLAAAFEAQGVLLDGDCCDPFYRKAIRVSMGHALSVPLAVASNLPAALGKLQGQGFGVWAAETSDDAVDLHACPPADRAVILVGNEGHGLDAALLSAADHVVRIPMAAGVPSLNVVSAASVVLWERARAIAVK